MIFFWHISCYNEYLTESLYAFMFNKTFVIVIVIVIIFRTYYYLCLIVIFRRINYSTCTIININCNVAHCSSLNTILLLGHSDSKFNYLKPLIHITISRLLCTCIIKIESTPVILLRHQTYKYICSKEKNSTYLLSKGKLYVKKNIIYCSFLSKYYLPC